jgi:glycosyltransferase involved in cell wall biosynthesis
MGNVPSVVQNVLNAAGMGRPIRLLWLIDSLTVGGAEALVVPFARKLDKQRFQLTVCALSTISGNPIEQRLQADGTRVITLGASDLRDRKAFRRLKELVTAEGIDLIHAHLTYSAIWSAFLSRATKIPSVVSLHVAPEATRALQTTWRQKLLTSVRDRLMRFVTRRWSSRVIMVSEALREIYAGGGGMARSSIRVVRNGIELERFKRDRDETRSRLSRDFEIPTGTPIVIAVSVLREGKGIEVLIEAAQRVQGAIFLIVGDGPKADEWRELTKEYGVTDRIRWAGYRTDVDNFLAGCDVFAHPSLSDAFPTVLLEAMAAGLPVVASDVGGIPEIVEPGETGVLVPAGDASRLAAAIQDLLSDRRRARDMGDRGRLVAEQKFSTEAWIDRLVAVYAEVLAEEESR